MYYTKLKQVPDFHADFQPAQVKLFTVCVLLNLDQICETWKDEYDATSIMDSGQNINLDTRVKRIHFLSFLNGHDSLYTYDWKRLLHNMEFKNADMDRMHDRYDYIDNMTDMIDGTSDSMEDIDLLIKSIEIASSDDNHNTKGLSMLRELEYVKGGKLCWTQLRAALKRIDRTDCVDAFEEWCVDAGKFVKNETRKSS